eukprot:3907273-Rhodomonas_salina.3
MASLSGRTPHSTHTQESIGDETWRVDFKPPERPPGQRVAGVRVDGDAVDEEEEGSDEDGEMEGDCFEVFAEPQNKSPVSPDRTLRAICEHQTSSDHMSAGRHTKSRLRTRARRCGGSQPGKGRV